MTRTFSLVFVSFHPFVPVVLYVPFHVLLFSPSPIDSIIFPLFNLFIVHVHFHLYIAPFQPFTIVVPFFACSYTSCTAVIYTYILTVRIPPLRVLIRTHAREYLFSLFTRLPSLFRLFFLLVLPRADDVAVRVGGL